MLTDGCCSRFAHPFPARYATTDPTDQRVVGLTCPAMLRVVRPKVGPTDEGNQKRVVGQVSAFSVRHLGRGANPPVSNPVRSAPPLCHPR